MVSPIARKQLDAMKTAQRKNIVESIWALESDPFKSRAKADIKKLSGVKGGADLYRLRVGNHRVIYEVSENKIWITEIVPRGKAYKFLL